MSNYILYTPSDLGRQTATELASYLETAFGTETCKVIKLADRRFNVEAYPDVQLELAGMMTMVARAFVSGHLYGIEYGVATTRREYKCTQEGYKDLMC